jgi:hypothetical protein
MARGKPVSSVYETEFIRLNLQDAPREIFTGIERPHPKG